MQPNKENIRKWVNALRSGEYRQTKGALKNDYGHCCLGVLCEVAIQHGLALTQTRTETDEGNECVAFNGEWGTAPEEVVAWAGIEKSNPELLSDERAAELNDDRGFSFGQIADLIEKKYLSGEAA